MTTMFAIMFSTFSYGLFIVLDAWLQSDEIKEGNWINHKWQAVLAFLWASVCAFFVIDHGVLFYCATVFYLLCFRWLAFDISINLMRGLKWDYVSKPSGKSALLDRAPFFMKPLLLGISILALYLSHGR